jgi:hypothetical protein
LSKSSELIPNSFQMPNFLADKLLRHLSGPQAKVLIVLCRKTFGWGKRVDMISLGQFQREAHLSRSSVYEALETFVGAGLLLKTSRGLLQVNEWSLNLEANAEDVIRFLDESSNAVKKPVCIAQRTSSPPELVRPENQNYIAQRTRDSSPGEPTETQETHKPILERKGKWDAAVEEGFDFFRKVLGKGPQYELNRHRRRLGIDGMRQAQRFAEKSGSDKPDENALALLKIAIERMRDDRWHNGEETGVKYLDWEQLFTSKTYRDRKLVDYWLNDDNLSKWGAA